MGEIRPQEDIGLPFGNRDPQPVFDQHGKLQSSG
jgi:hypothetical protein